MMNKILRRGLILTCAFTLSSALYAFDEACYLARYPDVVSGWVNKGQKAIDHWNRYGRFENRNPDCDPTPAFDEACYLTRYPDVVTGWVNKGQRAIDHWNRYGKSEGRVPGCEGLVTTPTTPVVPPASTVFNEACYLARYPDVVTGWVNKGQKAIDHWTKYGKGEGRIPGCDGVVTTPPPTPVTPPASTVFNEACYLERYPDVVTGWVAFGQKAIDHYNRYGKGEGRIAGCDQNSTAPSAPLPATMTIKGPGSLPIAVTVDNERFAGAVSSLTWNGKEFINIHDHGRQLQSAIQIDGYGECNNPTEAGSMMDDQKNTTTSRILSAVKSTESKITTKSQMAFWAYKKLTGACLKGMDERVTSPLSNHTIEKTINIGEFNDPSIIGYTVKFKHGEGTVKDFVVYEFLTGYLNSEFNRFYYIDKANQTVKEYTSSDLYPLVGQGFPNGSFIGKPSNKKEYEPVIMSDPTQNYAMGVYVSQESIMNCGSFFHGYQLYHFNLGGSGQYGNSTNKWSLAVNDYYQSACVVNGERSFKVYIIVDSLKNVASKLLNIANSIP